MTIHTYFLKSFLVFKFLFGTGTSGFIGKRDVVENIVVVGVPEVFLILEDRIEVVHTIPSEKSNISNHARNASCCKSSPGEANENDLVARYIVCSDEAVDFTNIL
jgi:hypothetical protein